MELTGPVQFVAARDITVDETRQRKAIAPAALDELAHSIETHGLLHPLVVSGNKLVSGRRRMLAIEKLHAAAKPIFFGDYPVPQFMLPVVEKSSLDAITQKEIELDENLKRVDLSWQERTAAIAELHALRVAQNPAQTIQDTSKEIAKASERSNWTHEKVQRALLVQPHLNDPEVKRANSAEAAHRIVVKKLEAEFAASRKHVAQKDLTLIRGEMELVLPKLEPAQFDGIIADPPYGIDADSFGSAAQEMHKYADSQAHAANFGIDLFYLANLVTKPTAHLYMFCDIDLFVVLKGYAENAGWKPWRTPLIWHKGGGSGHAPDPRRGPQRQYELILYAVRGGRYQRELRSDVITISPDRDKKHAAQKPVALYTELLSRSCTAGENVLDPCCGSGTIFAAARALKLKATGVEVDDKYHAIAAQRIAEL